MTVFCSGLHPSQQLTKYDGEVAAASTQNDVAHRLSQQGSGDVEHRGVAVMPSHPGADAALPPTGNVHVKAQTPAFDPSELYSKPSHVVGRRQGPAEPSAANDQRASYQYGEEPVLRDSDGRKPSLAGDLNVVVIHLLLSELLPFFITADYAMESCLCLSVCHTPVFCLNSIHILTVFHPRVAPPFLFFYTKRDGSTPTGTPITGASNARGV